MECLSIEELEQEGTRFDRAVFATPEIDAFCSSLDYILPAREAFAARLATRVLRGDAGYAVFVEENGILAGLDTVWGYSCPIIGPDPDAVLGEFATHPRDWRILLVPGVAREGRLWHALVRRYARGDRVIAGPVARRWVASLEGGFDGFLKRRSRRFRANLRRVERRAREACISIECPREETAAAVFDRILAVERTSWKGEQGTGLTSAGTRRFYEAMATRLFRSGQLRVLFAQRDGIDVGYIMGGVSGGRYRGFQFSYASDIAKLSIGHLLQQAQVRNLCSEGIEIYDLGMDLDYKRAWADGPFDSLTLAVATAPEASRVV